MKICRESKGRGPSLIRDVRYAGESDAQKLDIYVPGADGPFPVIIWMHPGGFFEGDKNGRGAKDPLSMVDMDELTQPMLARGYAVASINYRLSHEARFPSLIYDAKAAVRWVRANAATPTPTRAASHRGAPPPADTSPPSLRVSEGASEVEDLSMGNPKQSSGVAAAVDWYGPTDFLTMDSQTKQLGLDPWQGGHEASSSPESLLLGGPLRSLPEKCRASSPLSYAGPAHAPRYIQHGRKEDIVPYLQSVQLVERLEGVGGEGCEVVFEIVEGVGHAHPYFFRRENINRMLDFLDRYLKPTQLERTP